MTTIEFLKINKEQIINDFQNGQKPKELAIKYNCNQTYLNQTLRQWGINQNPREKHKKDYSRILQLYNSGVSAYQIGLDLNIPVMCVCRALHSFRIDISEGQRKHDGGLLKDKAKEIVEKYKSGTGCYKLAKEYNCAETSILRLLNDNNIEIRDLKQFTCDENFWEKIDNEASAYFLGLFMSDGCNMEEKGQICIQMCDKDIIEKFVKYINYTGNIILNRGRKENHLDAYKITISSKKLSQDLAKLGCVARKTYSIEFPKDGIIPDNLMNHWCRGEFCGDGTIFQYSKRLDWSVRIVGTKHQCDGMAKYISAKLNINATSTKVYTNKKTGFEIWRFNVSGSHQIKVFLDWLYKDATIFMTRKYNKYQEFLKYYNDKYTNLPVQCI